MIRWASNYFAPIPPIFIDGLTYTMIAVFMFLANTFGSDEAKLYIKPVAIFIIKTIVGAIGAFLLALKMYRSTAYGDHLAAKEEARKIQPLSVEANKDIPTP